MTRDAKVLAAILAVIVVILMTIIAVGVSNRPRSEGEPIPMRTDLATASTSRIS